MRSKQPWRPYPTGRIDELGDEDIATWVVVRVNDEITIDLMTEACGITFQEARSGIDFQDIQDVQIPFAGPQLMLRLKQAPRDKDAQDRAFLEKLIAESKTEDR